MLLQKKYANKLILISELQMLTYNKLYTLVNYLFIFLVINYNLFVKFIINIDSTGYGLIFLSVIVLFINYKKIINIQFSKPIVFWFIWCVFVLLNYFIHPHNHSIGIFSLYRKIFIPFITMIIVLIEYRKDPIKLLWVCFITHMFYMLAGYKFDPGILHRDLGEDNELGNAYGTISSFTLFYVVLLNKFKKINLGWLIGIFILVFVFLAMSGVRKAFGAGIILLICWILSIIDLKKIHTWILVILLAIGGIKGYNYLIENTFMGQRMEVLESQQENYLPPNAPEFLSIFGDRGPHYYYGWFMFLEKPIFGVGLSQSRVFDSYIHSEYMVQLTDNGIIGFSLFFLFYLWIILHLKKKLKNDFKMTVCILGGFGAILFLELTAWTWEFPQYFIALGVIIGFCKSPSTKLYYKS